MAKRPKGRKIINIKVDEVSLVDMPANLHPFQVVKRRIEMDEELKELLNSFAPSGDEAVAPATSLSADELKGALKLLKAIGEDLPTDVLKAIGAMGAAAALAVEKAAETTGDEPAGEEEETTSITFDELMEKAGSKFSKETKSALDTVLEEIKSAHKALAALLKNAKVGKAEGETTEEVPGGAEEKKFTQAEVDAIVADKVSAAETVAAQEAADLATEETLAAIG